MQYWGNKLHHYSAFPLASKAWQSVQTNLKFGQKKVNGRITLLLIEFEISLSLP